MIIVVGKKLSVFDTCSKRVKQSGKKIIRQDVVIIDPKLH